MATRFGSQVKALAAVLDGHELSFLDLKLADLTRLGVDVTLMTSFATHDALAAAVAGQRGPPRAAARVAAARRGRRAVRSTARARPRRTRPGHGDLADALELSGALERYRANGVRTLFVCNVDNVGATLDPALAGLHRELGGAITAELVSKRPGDVGGLPVRRADGSLAIAEAFRVPEGFPHEQFPLFNTNTLWIDLAGTRGARRVHLVRGAQERRRAARRSSSSGSSGSSRGGTRRATSTCPARAPSRASCRSRTRTTWPPRRSRSRRSPASGWHSISDRPWHAVSAGYGTCTDRVSRLADGRVVSDHPDCDQPAHAPQPRPARVPRRARRGRRRRHRHDDQRAGGRSVGASSTSSPPG